METTWCDVEIRSLPFSPLQLIAGEPSGLRSLFSLCLLILFVPPDPVKLWGSGTTDKEVDGKQVPVFRDDNQRIPGPDQPCGRQHCRLGGTEFLCWSSHISQTSHNQTPLEYRGPEENSFRTCWVVVNRSQLGGQHVLDPVQNPVVGRSERSHDEGVGNEGERWAETCSELAKRSARRVARDFKKLFVRFREITEWFEAQRGCCRPAIDLFRRWCDRC